MFEQRVVVLLSQAFARLTNSKSLHRPNERVLQVVNPQLYSSPHTCAVWQVVESPNLPHLNLPVIAVEATVINKIKTFSR